MTFPGFPPGKVRHTPIPAPFFTELLPQVDHLGELKLTLYVIWRLNRMEETFRYLRREDIAGDARFMQGMGKTTRAGEAALDEALERAVLRGALLKAALTQAGGSTGNLYFLNTQKGRAAIKGLEQGKWRPEDLPSAPIELNLERPNIFRLYEAHIGPLTPHIADTLRDAEETYPAEWITDAIHIAAENNVRRWRYVDAILRSWQEKGRNDRQDKQDPKENYRGYLEDLEKLRRKNQ